MNVPKDPEKYAKYKENLSNSKKRYWESVPQEKRKIKKPKLTPEEKSATNREAQLKHYQENPERAKKIGKANSIKMKEYYEGLSDEERVLRIEQNLKNWHKFEDTKIEQIFESILKSKGAFYEKQKWIKGFRVDFYLSSTNTIYEIQGCYTHQCEQCGFNNGSYGMSSGERREYDLQKLEILKSLGYNVQWIWEHTLKEYERASVQSCEKVL